MAKCLIASDRTIRAMRQDAIRMNDGNGLHLRRGKDGLFWYQDVTAYGNRFTLSLGPYPEVGLAAARDLSEQLRAKALQGVDLYAMRREEKRVRKQKVQSVRLLGSETTQSDSFEVIAAGWYEKRLPDWSTTHASKVLVRMKKHLFPALGKRPISDIQTKDIATLVMAIDRAGHPETARRVLAIGSSLFRYARVLGYVKENPCEGVKEFLRKPRGKHHAAITDPEQLKDYLTATYAYTGSPQVRAALQLSLMTLLRSSELRWARWEEIDLIEASWMVPAARMKQSKEEKLNGRPHYVPLSRQAVTILEQLRGLHGNAEYVFPGQGIKNPVISENTLNKAIRSMGFSTRMDMTTHGSRATARTMLVEQLGWRSELADMQLHHEVADANGNAYNRAEFEAERFEMMQEWADYLDEVRAGRVQRRVRSLGKNKSAVAGDGQQWPRFNLVRRDGCFMSEPQSPPCMK